MDEDTNVFFSRQLEQLRAQAFEVQYAALKGMQLVPVKSDFNIGAVEYTYRVFDKVGTADVLADYSDVGPRVDIKGFETTTKFRRFGDSYGYSIEEVRNAIMAGLDLSNRKATAARDAIAILVDDSILLGSAAPKLGATGFSGLFTATGTEIYTVPNGGSNSTLWSAKTPDEIVQDMHAMVHQVEQNSNEIEKCDTMVLPLAVKGLVSSTRMGDGSNQTILSHFLETNTSIKTVEFTQKLNANSAWSGRRAVCYKRDPQKLEAIIVTEFEQLPPQYNGYEAITLCNCKVGGTVIYFPKSIIYADGI
jgi:hypothetical protein